MQDKRLQASSQTFITLLLQHPKFLLLQHEVLLLLRQQTDRTCFVSANGNNGFQDNRVKFRVVTFVYVYFRNMLKKTTFKNSFKVVIFQCLSKRTQRL